MKKDKLLRIKEVAEVLGRSPKTIRRYIKEGRIVGCRQGEHGWYGVLESELRAYLRRCNSVVLLERVDFGS